MALTLLVCLAFSTRHAVANDIQVSSVTGLPFSGGNGEVQFNITWQNSWRRPFVDEGGVDRGVWDAAWVFCKIRINGGAWQHLRLNQTGHTVPGGAQLDVGRADTGAAWNASTNPNVGAFL